jgi:hypothetical protein
MKKMSKNMDMITRFNKMDPNEQKAFIHTLRTEQSYIGVAVDVAIMNWLITIGNNTVGYYPNQRMADFNATLNKMENFIQWIRAINSFSYSDEVTSELQDHITALLNTQESRNFVTLVLSGDSKLWPWFFQVPILMMTSPDNKETYGLSWKLQKDHNENFYATILNLTPDSLLDNLC